MNRYRRTGYFKPSRELSLAYGTFRPDALSRTVAAGKVIMLDGIVIGSGGTIVTTERGLKALKDQGISAEVSNLADSLLYTAPSG